MNRRGFLKGLISLVATATLDPDKLLWVPGQKTIFIPKPLIEEHAHIIGSVDSHSADAFGYIIHEVTTMEDVFRQYDIGRYKI